MKEEIAVAEIPSFTKYPVAIEAYQIFGMYMDVSVQIHIIGPHQSVSIIPGMVSEDVSVEIITKGTHDEDGQHCRRTGITLVEGVDVPYGCGEM